MWACALTHSFSMESHFLFLIESLLFFEFCHKCFSQTVSLIPYSLFSTPSLLMIFPFPEFLECLSCVQLIGLPCQRRTARMQTSVSSHLHRLTQLCLLTVVWPQASYMISLDFILLMFGTIIVRPVVQVYFLFSMSFQQILKN